jgi:hypothetical protein
VCHQSVGLIAREIEAAGIPTLSLTSAWSITAAVRPPRAAFVDHPLGRTSGRAGDPEGQRTILASALATFETLDEPGTIVDLGCLWGDDEWRARPLSTGDGGSGRSGERGDARGQRHPTPQYQTDDDRRLAEARLGEAALLPCDVFDA